MIYPIQYGGEQVGKGADGKVIKIPVHPKHALKMSGPMLQVAITQPTKIIEILAKQNRQPKMIAINALIDTGASSCIITDKLAKELELIQTGFQKITSVQDQQDRPKYFARLQFPWGKAVEVAVASCPLTGVDCLIGRDVLMHWHLTYNGVTGQITICD